MRAFLAIALIFFASFAAANEKSLFGNGIVQIGSHHINVEIANTDKARQQGLMERQSLLPNHGMLFVFDDEQVRHFWMKNTYIPLTIGFFDKAKKLIDIQDMKPVNSPMDLQVHRYQSIKPAMFALEVNQGWFARNKVKLGTRFVILKSSTKKK